MIRSLALIGLISLPLCAFANSANVYCEARGNEAETFVVAKGSGVKEDWMAQAIATDPNMTIQGKVETLGTLHRVYSTVNVSASPSAVHNEFVDSCMARAAAAAAAEVHRP